MKHQQEHEVNISQRFIWAIALTTLTFAIELYGGFWTGSLALLSDAAHVFMDSFALILSFAALLLARLPVTDKRTYGLHRTEVFAALFNGITLLIVSLLIFWEAFQRINGAPEIKSLEMLGIAAIGLIINMLVAIFLHEASHHDLNVKSAFLHVISDALTSVGVILCGIIIYFTQWFILDPLVSIGIGIVILFSTYRILRQSINLLLEGVPEHIDTQMVIKEIEEIQGILEVRDIHIWGICSNICALSAHIKVKTDSLSECQDIMAEVNKKLLPLGIQHTTLQLEIGNKKCLCSDGGKICQS